MTEIIGRQIELGVGVENVRGTPQVTAEHWVKKISANILAKAEKVVDESTRNVLEDSLGSRVVKKWFEGDLEGNVQVDMIGYLFYNIYGSVISANVAGSVYSHTFSVLKSITHPALSLFAKDGANSQEVFDTGMVGSLELTASMDDYVKFTASFMAAAGSANADTPSYATEYDFIGKDITVKVAATQGALAGATATKVKDLSVTWDTGLINDHVFGSYDPDNVLNGRLSLEGEITLNYDDDTFKDLYTADTTQYMQITIQGAADIGGGSNPTIDLILNKVQIQDWNRDDSSDELVPQTVSFKAFYNETDGEQSELVLTNLTTEYATALTN